MKLSGAAALGPRILPESAEGANRCEFLCLNAHWFLSLADAREKMEDWRKYYNEERPHGAIGQKAPIMLLNHHGAAGPS
jgi:putative transposase